MAPTTTAQNRAKFDKILQLSRDQYRAIESNDLDKFRSILTAKGDLIGSLSGTRQVVEQDPSIHAVIEQIKESEKKAENLLSQRLETIGLQLTEIHRARAAKCEYRKVNRKLPSFVPDPNTPMIFDRRS
jgi:hypothetical protein